MSFMQIYKNKIHENESTIDKIDEKKEEAPQKPDLYRVIILNDDYTPMAFVVHILKNFFQKDHESAVQIMLHVHNHGLGECGVYSLEIAETKVSQVMSLARQFEHPLQCLVERK